MCKTLSDAHTPAAKIAIHERNVGRKKYANINDQNLMCTHYQIPCKVDNVRCDAREGERKRHGEKEKWLLSNVLSPCDSSIKSYKARDKDCKMQNFLVHLNRELCLTISSRFYCRWEFYLREKYANTHF